MIHDNRGQGMMMWALFLITTFFIFFAAYTLLFGYWQQFFDIGIRLGADNNTMNALENNMIAAPFIFSISIIGIFILYMITRG